MIYKEELVTAVSAETGLSKKDTRDCIDAALEFIMNSMSEYDSVQLVGFGTFEMKKRAARIGRNPHTGEAVPIPERYIPNFIPGKILKEKVEKLTK